MNDTTDPTAGERQWRDPATGALGPVHDPRCAALTHDDEDSCSCGAAEADAGDVEALRVRAERLLVQCGSCDGGLPMGCACSTDDPRPVIAALLDALAAVRREAEQKALTESADTWERLCTRGHPLDAEVADRIVPWLRDRAARIGGESR